MNQKIFFPQKEQFDLMNEHLGDIATALYGAAKVESWRDIQRIVKTGNGEKLFPIGTTLYAGEIPFQVMGHSLYQDAKNPTLPTMTLMSKDALGQMSFDAPEAFYYAETDLPSGTYSFVIPQKLGQWESGTYYFITDRTLSAGGHFTISGNTGTPLTGLYVLGYNSGMSDVWEDLFNFGDDDYTFEEHKMSILKMTSDTNPGTLLGTFGQELNDVGRVGCGSNNYGESNIRSYINGRDFSAPTKYDRGSFPIFSKISDQEFLSVVCDSLIPCVSNDVYEASDSVCAVGEAYIAVDKFFLPAYTELFGEPSSGDIGKEETVQFPFFVGASDVDRIKNQIVSGYHLRTPAIRRSYSNLCVTGTGTWAAPWSSASYGVVLCCNI